MSNNYTDVMKNHYLYNIIHSNFTEATDSPPPPKKENKRPIIYCNTKTTI